MYRTLLYELPFGVYRPYSDNVLRELSRRDLLSADTEEEEEEDLGRGIDTSPPRPRWSYLGYELNNKLHSNITLRARCGAESRDYFVHSSVFLGDDEYVTVPRAMKLYWKCPNDWLINKENLEVVVVDGVNLPAFHDTMLHFHGVPIREMIDKIAADPKAFIHIAHVIGCLRLKKIAQIWWQKNTTITLGNVREVNRFAKKYMCQRMRKKVDRFLQQYYVNGILCFNA